MPKGSKASKHSVGTNELKAKMIAKESCGFATQLRFFANDKIYEHEKPYGFKVPPENYPRTNIKINRVNDVYIEDMRGSESSFTVETNGFAIRNISCDLAYEDYHDSEAVKPYFREVEELLKNMLGASQVEVFRYQIRKRHATWPIATEKVYSFDQPTTTVHVGKGIH